MDQIEHKNACQPWLRPGLEKLEEEYSKRVVYINKESIDLANSADTEVWEPSDYIREIVPNFDDIEIEIIGSGKASEINSKLIEQGDVGLIVMGSDISRNARPSLIVLTTNEKLYVIYGEDREIGIKFLQSQFAAKNPFVKFWTTNGVNEADSLYHNYGIDMEEGNAICCTGLHLYMMRIMRKKPEAGTVCFPPVARRLCRRKRRLEKFNELVEIWLDIPREDIQYSRNQLAHLNSRPLNRTAINLVKKRCIIVANLVKQFRYYSRLEIDIMSRNAFDRLTTCNERVKQDIVAGIRRKEESGKSDRNYFIHLDTGIGMCSDRNIRD